MVILFDVLMYTAMRSQSTLPLSSIIVEESDFSDTDL